MIGGAALFVYQDKLQTARQALDRAEQDLISGDHTDALERLSAGLKAIRWLPMQQDLKQSFQSRLVLARRARAIQALHHLVEQLRFLDHAADIPPARLRELDAGCRAIWQARREFIPANPTGPKDHAASEETDLLDLALLWTRLIVHNAAPGQLPTEQSKALAILDEAQDMWGQSLALRLARCS